MVPLFVHALNYLARSRDLETPEARGGRGVARRAEVPPSEAVVFCVPPRVAEGADRGYVDRARGARR